LANAIEVQGVSKFFRLYHEKTQSLKERAITIGRRSFDDFWALEGIDIEVEQGSTMGLLGHNGSGKSTLLKCIAGILQPTSGEIRTVGRIAALLELGAGMQPDLTGRENIFLNGSILGLSKRDLEKRFDDIVEFSELQQFIDTQVRFYSSGMYVRLGFAVAVNVDPDILLVDEVLAVGDEAFQRKCLDRVKQFQTEGRTIIVVTHAPDLVRMVCDHAAVLDHGVKVADGTPGEAVRVFREHLLQHEEYVTEHAGGHNEVEQIDVLTPPPPPIHVDGVHFEYPHCDEREYLLPREPLDIRIGWVAEQLVEAAIMHIFVHGQNGVLLFSTNTEELKIPLRNLEGKGEVIFHIDEVPLFDGNYLVTIGLTNAASEVYQWLEQQHRFAVMNPGLELGLLALHVHGELRGEDEPQ
jgi:ABC-2 type transport system ATP-binding protein